MFDLKLDTETHDLLIGTDLTLISGLDYLEQKIKIVLWFFFAEWFLNVTLGIKYFEFIFIKNPNLTLIDSLFKVAIIEIGGVLELQSFDSQYSSSGRHYSIQFTVSADLGILNLVQEFTI